MGSSKKTEKNAITPGNHIENHPNVITSFSQLTKRHSQIVLIWCVAEHNMSSNVQFHGGDKRG